jgi:hypothetical protein
MHLRILDGRGDRPRRTSITIGVVAALLLLSASAARAATYSVTLGANRAAASGTGANTAQSTLGGGSWYELYPSAKAELYVSPLNDLGVAFTVDDILSVSYRTYNIANAVPVEFFLAIYTAGTAHGWYEQRINAEPYLKNAPAYSPVLGSWMTWSTSGPGELTFTDHNNAGNAGFYGAPTLADIQAGPINWSTWPGNPTSGSASVTPIDYGAQSVFLLSFQTGSGWAAFESHIDEIVIDLVGGDTYIIDLEATPDPIYVDDDWAGSMPGTPFGGGRYFGLNAFDTVPGGIAAALSGATVFVAPGSYPANVSLGKSITLSGAQAGVPGCGRVVGAPNPAVESVLAGPGPTLLTLVTGCAGATIDGFAFSGGTRSIESTSGPLHDLTIQNNHMGGFTGGAIFLNDAGTEVTVHQNNVDGTSKVGGGGMVHLDTDSFSGFHLTDNCIVDGPTATGFFVDGNRNVNATGSRAPLISGNLLRGNATGANLGSRAFTDGTISDNDFEDNLFDGLQGGIKNTAITGNTFSGNGRSGLALTSFGSLDPLRGAQGSTITLNDFVGNVREGLFYSSTQAPGTVSTNPATQNNFSGNGDGVFYAGSETLTLTCNWWNSADGPDKSPENPNPPGEDLAAASANFVQWLDAPAPGGLCIGGDDVTPGPAPSCISVDNPCVTIPVAFDRVDATPMRGFSVTFTLSPELELCSGLSSITEGSYLSGVGATNFQVLDNGGGSYTVDCAILGLPCGAVGDGNLFDVAVTNSGGDGTGTITVTSVIARDCANAPIPAYPGADLDIEIDNTLPAAVSNLAAAQVKVGNDADGTTKIALTFTPPGDADLLHIYRAGFGDYPEYDDGSGAVPATPAWPPAGPWALAATIPGSSTSHTDEVASRDFWYYVLFVEDACGNVSAVSNKTTGTLNYHLGDTHDGFADCSGNNLVSTSDISHLGANYGVVGLPYGDPRNCLDVGPTTDFSVNARPTTDNRIQFEDLILFAINHGTVSAPGRIDSDGSGNPATARNVDIDRLELESSPSTGELVARLRFEGSGNIQGLSVDLDWNAAAVEPVGIDPGELAGAQSRQALVLSAGPGNVDVALLGPGNGFTGDGELALVRFRVIGEGDPSLRIARVDARDRSNRPVDVSWTGGPEIGASRPPVATLLGAGYPNPSRGSTLIPMSLAAPGRVRLSIFDMQGRLVRTLIDADVDAGERSIAWDGRESGGAPVASGVYAVRLEATGQVFTRTIQIVR